MSQEHLAAVAAEAFEFTPGSSKESRTDASGAVARIKLEVQ